MLNKLLARSLEFEEEMLYVLSHQSFDNSDRIRISKILCAVSFEHA